MAVEVACERRGAGLADLGGTADCGGWLPGYARRCTCQLGGHPYPG